MAVTVSAALVGVASPRLVQVTVEGLSVGHDVRVLGVLGGFTWDVRGGAVVASSSQLVVLDDLTPVNRPVQYRVEVEGVTAATSDPITVPFHADHLLMSIDGSVVVPFAWEDNADPRSITVDQHLTYVPGRRHPVVRFALAGGESGQWSLRTETPTATAALADMIGAGAPVALRSTGLVRDFPPVEVVALVTNTRTLVGDLGWRRWDLSWVALDDPLSDQPVPGDTFADVDAAYEGSTFADLDAAYAGSTFGDWNRTDWVGMAAGA